MQIKELSIQEFKEFTDNHFIKNYYETLNYAILKAEEGYDYELIGYGGDSLVAAALVLYTKIGNYYYGYSPRGFLIDYSNITILNDFTKAIKEYYKVRKFVFIKINPEIAISKLNTNTLNFEYNENYKLVNNLINTGYTKLKDNCNFEARLPRVNAIVNLKDFNFNNLSKNTKNKIRKGFRKGLTLEIAQESKIDILYQFIKNKKDNDIYYYKNLYNVFNKTDSIDLLLIKVDYKNFLINTTNKYQEEQVKNNYLNSLISVNNNINNINKKMQSDKSLLSYKNDIAEASKDLNTEKDTYVAGAIIIKHDNRICVEISGYDKSLSRFAPNYFLYFAILEYYKDKYSYADLGGITADLSHDNKYYGLNRFKLGFKPDVYEYIGEYDLIIDENRYKYWLKTGELAREFNKE